ncbi:hypothetical protein HNQ59_003298 [Chitinivorax tropicus]|uniref:DUF3103 family protein n=1 Tax=Chitinivorax tropicus TaxID=714531 RepID=A0A840MNI2_9PROT|nr:DUF3103 family protein [Chitinivorax tropicus]MBB5019990.1 hypothetical protein [Chitinivorax tropicus]
MALPKRLRQLLIGVASLTVAITTYANEPILTPAGTLPGQPTQVDQAKRETARQIAKMLADPAFASALQKQLGQSSAPTGNKAAPLRAILNEYTQRAPRISAFSRQQGEVQSLRQMDQGLLNQKGIAALSQGLLQVRLYEPKSAQLAPQPIDQMWVAFEPAGDDKQWKTIEAFDSQGRVHLLDAKQAPNFPVLVADIDGKEDLRAGIKLANQILTGKGLQQSNVARREVTTMAAMAQTSGFVDTAKLDHIRLNKDEEPWISGAAEVYAVVSGVQPDQAKAQIQIVDMPYLDYEGKDYYPNQILIQWADFRYAAANVQLFEHDDNTNYKDLVLAITSGVEKILGAFKPEYAVIGTVANAIVQAMPSHWFTNDDDYLDSFYTLEKNRTYTNWMGAAGNATITLSPYRLNEQ